MAINPSFHSICLGLKFLGSPLLNKKFLSRNNIKSQTMETLDFRFQEKKKVWCLSGPIESIIRQKTSVIGYGKEIKKKKRENVKVLKNFRLAIIDIHEVFQGSFDISWISAEEIAKNNKRKLMFLAEHFESITMALPGLVSTKLQTQSLSFSSQKIVPTLYLILPLLRGPYRLYFSAFFLIYALLRKKRRKKREKESFFR